MGEESSQPIANQLNMQKNYGIDIFAYDGKLSENSLLYF